MISQAVVRKAQASFPTPSSKPHLLIVTDSADRLSSLQASMQINDIEITGAISSAELSRACQREHKLVVIDVSPHHLPEILHMLRTCVRHSGISLLVEASRIVAAPGLAGLLPQYRAMPCSPPEMVKLARRLLTGEARPRKNWKLL